MVRRGPTVRVRQRAYLEPRPCRKRLLFLLPRWKLRPSSSTRRGSILVENRINRPGRVKIPVGTSDQDAESLGRERSADWHSHLSLHGHRGLDQALARARHQALRRGPGGAPTVLARVLRPPRRGGGRYTGRRLLLRLSNRPRRPRGSRGGARGARLGPHPRANRRTYG